LVLFLDVQISSPQFTIKLLWVQYKFWWFTVNILLFFHRRCHRKANACKMRFKEETEPKSGLFGVREPLTETFHLKLSFKQKKFDKVLKVISTKFSNLDKETGLSLSNYSINVIWWEFYLQNFGKNCNFHFFSRQENNQETDLFSLQVRSEKENGKGIFLSTIKYCNSQNLKTSTAEQNETLCESDSGESCNLSVITFSSGTFIAPKYWLDTQE